MLLVAESELIHRERE